MTSTYKCITSEEGSNKLEELEEEVRELIIFTRENQLDNAEKTYFLRDLSRRHNMTENTQVFTQEIYCIQLLCTM